MCWLPTLSSGTGPAAGTEPVAKQLTPSPVDPGPGSGLTGHGHLGAAIRSRHGNGGCESGMSLTPQEVMKVVNRYIGVSGGYLGDFSYRTHAEFYPEYCDLDIDPNNYAGTTRERFIEILSTQPPRDQAKILRGVIDRFNEDGNPARARLRPELEAWINRLESAPAVGLDTPVHIRDVVLRALADADELNRANGATSAVDRIHTALHGHVLALCEAAGIEADRETTMNRALKLLRNNASVAHPNEELLDEPEAHLAINAARTVFAFLDAKLGAPS